MQTMYSGKVNSPATTLDGGVNDVVTIIDIVNGSVLPNAPNLAVIGTDEDAETILYSTKVGNQLSNITRGFQGIAKEWSTGETIARLFTEYDYASLKANLGTIAGRKITDFAECSSAELADKITDETGSGKAVFGTEGVWTPVIRGSGIAGTYEISSHMSNYTKIGRVVHLETIISLDSPITGGGTGYLQIIGCPFAKMANSSPQGVVRTKKVDFTGTFLTASFIGSGVTTVLHIAETVDGGADIAMPVSSISASDVIYISITFFV